MTPKEKATELFIKYFEFVEALSVSNQLENAKQCALIAINEIIENTFCKFKTQYWQEVKQEIENYED